MFSVHGSGCLGETSLGPLCVSSRVTVHVVHHRSVSTVDGGGVVRTSNLATTPFDDCGSTPLISFTGHTDDSASSSSVVPRNHAYFCLDVANCRLAAQMVSFPFEVSVGASAVAVSGVRNHSFLCLDVVSATIVPQVIDLLRDKDNVVSMGSPSSNVCPGVSLVSGLRDLRVSSYIDGHQFDDVGWSAYPVNDAAVPAFF